MWNPLRYLKIAPAKSSTELWQVGIVHAPIATLQTQTALASARITWLPHPGSFRFNADPFGLWQNGEFTVFVEALDYRVKRGEIHYYRYYRDWTLKDHGPALRTPFHLSYPSLIEEGGEIYMLPEAHKSGKLTLYRATRFPDQWEPVTHLLDIPAIDASVIKHENKWWMFYALPGANGRAMRELHIAYADTLTGPWQQHSMNPVRTGLDSARPGGTPYLHENALYLPTQDCTTGYGTAISLLRIDTLTPNQFEATLATSLTPQGLHAEYPDGLHTLAAAGDVTLIDVKQIRLCQNRRWINLQRRLRRLVGRA